MREDLPRTLTAGLLVAVVTALAGAPARAQALEKPLTQQLCLACAQSLEAAGVAMPRVLRLVEAIRFLATAASVVH